MNRISICSLIIIVGLLMNVAFCESLEKFDQYRNRIDSLASKSYVCSYNTEVIQYVDSSLILDRPTSTTAIIKITRPNMKVRNTITGESSIVENVETVSVDPESGRPYRYNKKHNDLVWEGGLFTLTQTNLTPPPNWGNHQAVNVTVFDGEQIITHAATSEPGRTVDVKYDVNKTSFDFSPLYFLQPITKINYEDKEVLVQDIIKEGISTSLISVIDEDFHQKLEVDFDPQTNCVREIIYYHLEQGKYKTITMNDHVVFKDVMLPRELEKTTYKNGIVQKKYRFTNIKWDTDDFEQQ